MIKMEKLTNREKKEIILGLIYKHFEMEFAESLEDEEIADIIIKICEENKK